MVYFYKTIQLIISSTYHNTEGQDSWLYIISNGIVQWGCASKSNIAIMQRYQSKILRLITNAPWYVNNQTLHTDLQIPFVHTVFQDHIRKHRNTLESHPNPLVEPILHSEHNRSTLAYRNLLYNAFWLLIKEIKKKIYNN